MDLCGKQREKLQSALISAFPDKASLDQMLSNQLNKNLDVIAGGENLKSIVFNLIKKAEAEGWVEKLIDAACKSNPGNPKLKTIAEEIKERLMENRYMQAIEEKFNEERIKINLKVEQLEEEHRQREKKLEEKLQAYEKQLLEISVVHKHEADVLKNDIAKINKRIELYEAKLNEAGKNEILDDLKKDMAELNISIEYYKDKLREHNNHFRQIQEKFNTHYHSGTKIYDQRGTIYSEPIIMEFRKWE